MQPRKRSLNNNNKKESLQSSTKNSSSVRCPDIAAELKADAALTSSSCIVSEATPPAGSSARLTATSFSGSGGGAVKQSLPPHCGVVHHRARLSPPLTASHHQLFAVADLLGIIAEFIPDELLSHGLLTVNRAACYAALWRLIERRCSTATIRVHPESGLPTRARCVVGFYGNVSLRLSFDEARCCMSISPDLFHPCSFSIRRGKCEMNPRKCFTKKPERRGAAVTVSSCRIATVPVPRQSPTATCLASFLHILPFPTAFFDATRDLSATVASTSTSYSAFSSDSRSAAYFSHMDSCSDTNAAIAPFVFEALDRYACLIRCRIFGLRVGGIDQQGISSNGPCCTFLAVPCIVHSTVAEFKWLLKCWIERNWSKISRRANVDVHQQSRTVEESMLYHSEAESMLPDLLCCAVTVATATHGVLSDLDLVPAELLNVGDDDVIVVLEELGHPKAMQQQRPDGWRFQRLMKTDWTVVVYGCNQTALSLAARHCVGPRVKLIAYRASLDSLSTDLPKHIVRDLELAVDEDATTEIHIDVALWNHTVRHFVLVGGMTTEWHCTHKLERLSLHNSHSEVSPSLAVAFVGAVPVMLRIRCVQLPFTGVCSSHFVSPSWSLAVLLQHLDWQITNDLIRFDAPDDDDDDEGSGGGASSLDSMKALFHEHYASRKKIKLSFNDERSYLLQNNFSMSISQGAARSMEERGSPVLDGLAIVIRLSC